MACDVQSFGATLGVSKSCRAEEEAIHTQSRQKTDSWRLYLRHVWPHLCFSTHTAKLILIIRDQRSVVSTAQSIISEPAKMAEPIEMLFGLRTRVSQENRVLDGDPSRSPMRMHNFGRKGRSL